MTNVAFTASGKYGIFSGGVGLNAYKRSERNRYSQYLLIEAKKTFIKRFLKAKKLTTQAKALLSSGDSVSLIQFASDFGDHYVTSIVEGGSAQILFTFESSNFLSYSKTRAALQLSVKSFAGRGDLNLSTSSVFDHQNEETNYSIEYELNGGNIISLPNIQADTIINYVLKVWPGQIQKSPQIIGFGFGSILEVDGIDAVTQGKLAKIFNFQQEYLYHFSLKELDYMDAVGVQASLNEKELNTFKNDLNFNKTELNELRNLKDECASNIFLCNEEFQEEPYFFSIPPSTNFGPLVLGSSFVLDEKSKNPFMKIEPNTTYRFSATGHWKAVVKPDWNIPPTDYFDLNGYTASQKEAGWFLNEFRAYNEIIMCRLQLVYTRPDGEEVADSGWGGRKGYIEISNSFGVDLEIYWKAATIDNPKSGNKQGACHCIDTKKPTIIWWKIPKE